MLKLRALVVLLWSGCALLGVAKPAGAVFEADIIIAVDGSATMANEVAILTPDLASFTSSVLGAGVDARFVLISRDSTGAGGICASSPLGSGACPADENLPVYRHVVSSIGSGDAFGEILATHPSWSSSLRTGSSRTLIVVSDSNDFLNETTFESQLVALDSDFAGYRFHAFVADDFFFFEPCSLVASAPGTAYRNLVSQTGGVFVDLCDQDFAPFLSATATQIIADVPDCAPGCGPIQFDDGVCDAACDVAACDFDGGDCECAPGCDSNSLGDGTCDALCDVAACGFDAGDCDCAVGCTAAMVGDGACDLACDQTACGFDGGDCTCAVGCQTGWVGDGVCNSACNAISCSFDGGDCSSQADVLIFVDGSGSMALEAALLELELNAFAGRLVDAGIDLQLILIAEDSSQDSGICSPQPLGSGSCPADQNPPGYRHVVSSIGGGDLFDGIIGTYDDWSPHLRASAGTMIIGVSDENDGTAASTFDAQLLALDNDLQGYRFHAVVPGAYSPGDPCESLAGSPGTEYIALANQSGGTFSDLCGQNMAVSFTEVSTAVVENLTPPPETPTLGFFSLTVLAMMVAGSSAVVLTKTGTSSKPNGHFS